ncbi:hypothetical protein [Enterocloster sp.]|uniref:hypothetical protein n=1 Tax=Enterocloster sp. TaxID=2719315 RepID=UPI0039A2AB82
MLLSVREVRATELRDVSFHVCPGEVVGFIHPDDTYCREIVRLLSGELKVESGSAWLAGRQVELAGGRRTWSDTVLDILRITRRVFFKAGCGQN